MSVLFYAGFESGAVSGASEGGPAAQGALSLLTTGGTPAINSTTPRSGDYICRIASPTGESAMRFSGPTRTADRTYWSGFGFRKSANPSTARVIHDNSGVIAVRLNTDGTIQLDHAGATPSAALSNDTWYHITLESVVNVGGNDTVKLFLDGTQIDSLTQAITDTLGGNWDFGLNGSATGNFDYDDIFLSDDQGSAPVNARPDQPKVLMSPPVADASNTGWTDNDNSTTNLYQSIDNRPPVGVLPAAGAGTADLMVKNDNSTTTENLVVEVEDALTIGIGASDVILATELRGTNGLSSATSTTNTSLQIVATDGHPGTSETNHDPNAVAGNWPTNWISMSNGIQQAPTITDRSVNPQVEIGKRTATTRVVGVAQVRIDWLYVEAAAADATVEAPAATVAAPGAVPTPEVRVEPAAATVLSLAAAPVAEVRVEPGAAAILATAPTVVLIVPLQVFADFKAQRFLMFGPAGLRKLKFKMQQAPTEAAQNVIVVSPAATVNVPGANPTPEVRVEPSAAAILSPGAAPVPEILVAPAAATALAHGASPVPEVRVEPAAATVSAPGAPPVPEIRVEPAAATILSPGAAPVPEIRVEPAAAIVVTAAGTPTPEIRVEPAAATALHTAAAPVPEVRVEPAAALIVYAASGIRLTEGYFAADLKLQHFLTFGPGGRLRGRFKMKPRPAQGSSAIDRTIIVGAATISIPGATPIPTLTILPAAASALHAAAAPVPEVRTLPAAATVLAAASAPVPEVRVEPGAATVVYTASGAVTLGGDVLVISPAATILAPGAPPVPEVRILPGAATATMPGAAPVPAISVEPGAATVVVTSTAVPEVRVLTGAAAYSSPGVAPTLEVRVEPAAARIVVTASGVFVGPPGQVNAPAARVAVRAEVPFVFEAAIVELTGEITITTLTGEVTIVGAGSGTLTMAP